MDKDKAWCPECFDQLETIEIKDKIGWVESHEYECFGCQKRFKLVECLSNLKEQPK